MINNNYINLLNSNVKKQIINQINLLKSNYNYEYEIRFGFIQPQRFVTDIPFNVYKQYMDLMSLAYPDARVEYKIYYDLYKDKVRTRYLYLSNFNKNVKLNTIKKQKLENVDIDLKYIYDIDMRFSLSNEEPVNDDVTQQNTTFTLEKKRYAFIFDIFSFDFTEISKIDNKGERDRPQYQIELEIIDKSLESEILLNKIIKTINYILGLTIK